MDKRSSQPSQGQTPSLPRVRDREPTLPSQPRQRLLPLRPRMSPPARQPGQPRQPTMSLLPLLPPLERQPRQPTPPSLPPLPRQSSLPLLPPLPGQPRQPPLTPLPPLAALPRQPTLPPLTPLPRQQQEKRKTEISEEERKMERDENRKMERDENRKTEMDKLWLPPLPWQTRKKQLPPLTALPLVPPQPQPPLPPLPKLPQLPALAQVPQLPRLPPLPQQPPLPPVPRQPPVPALPCPESPRDTVSRGTELGSAGHTGPRARSPSPRLPPRPKSPVPRLLLPPSTGAQEAPARPALAAGASWEPLPLPATPSAAPASQHSQPGTAPLQHQPGTELSLVSDTELLQELHRRGLLPAGTDLSLISDTELLQELHRRLLLRAGTTEAPLLAAGLPLLGGITSQGQSQQEEDKELCQGTDGLGKQVSQGEDVQLEGDSNVQELSQLEEDIGKTLSPQEEDIGKPLSPREEDILKPLSPQEEGSGKPLSPALENPVPCGPTDSSQLEHHGTGKETDVESQLEHPQGRPRSGVFGGMKRIRNWFRKPRDEAAEREHQRRQKYVEKWLEAHLSCNYNINEERRQKGEELARQKAEQMEREYREKYEGRDDWIEEFLLRSPYCPVPRKPEQERDRPQEPAQGEESKSQGLAQEKADQEEQLCQGPGENDQAKELSQEQDNRVQGLSQGHDDKPLGPGSDDDPLEGPSYLYIPSKSQRPLSSKQPKAYTSPSTSEEQTPARSRSSSQGSQVLQDTVQPLIHDILSKAVLEVDTSSITESYTPAGSRNPSQGSQDLWDTAQKLIEHILSKAALEVQGCPQQPQEQQELGQSSAADMKPAVAAQAVSPGTEGSEAPRAVPGKRPSLLRRTLRAVHRLFRWPRRPAQPHH
ncbi:histone-lysine N-methyltransferase 2D-like [Pseudopipra pipra]|uniref:histone-lysine N-methyltransferase 2D-like n=1 Tax=Pseudopipra pipra TaxID=415032 RepID=UPI003138686C